MKTVAYKSLRDGVITRMGIDAAQSLLPSQSAAIAEYLSSAAFTAWTFFDWPEIYLTEERTPNGADFVEGGFTYEHDYIGTVSYIGRALANSDYASPAWRIKRITTTASGEVQNIDTAIDVAWNDRLTATYIESTANETTEIPYILFNQLGKTPIGEVLHIYDREPNGLQNALSLKYLIAEDRVLITDSAYAGGTVFVQFALPLPVFTSSDYSAGTAYTAGDLVYYPTTGDCYRALQVSTGILPTNGEYWLRQRAPHFLAEYLKSTAFAETLSEDGQMDKSSFHLAKAESHLLKAMDDAWLRRGQVRTYSARFN